MGGEEEALREGVSVDREELKDAPSPVSSHEDDEGRVSPLEERERSKIVEEA